MTKKLRELVKDKNLLLVGVLFLLGVILRFYKLGGFVTFLGDQGRDAIIIKRILTFEHFPAIGPPTSVGQVYLGPFYYYFIAPWLWLFNFDPLGLAFGVALISSLYILINYFIVRDLFDKRVALLSTLFVAFSSVLIEFSRFSWNPNLLSLFSLLTIYFFIKSFKNFSWKFFILAGAFLSFSIQLHYLALFLIPPIALFVIIQFFEQKKELKKIFTGIVSSLATFILFSIPLVIFDLRHNFLNSNNFLKLFRSSSSSGINKVFNFLESFLAFNQYAFNAKFGIIFSSIIFILFILSLFFVIRKNNNLRNLLIFFIVTAIGVSFYLSARYPHYFLILYPLYYILIAYFLTSLLSSNVGKFVMAVFLISFILLNSQRYYFLTARENNQIGAAQKVARIIADNSVREGYRLTSLPQQYGDYTYRYFLEIWGKKPIEKGSFARTPTLFVVCEEECKPIGDPQWDIAYFAPRKIVGTWKVNSVKIYKLTR